MSDSDSKVSSKSPIMRKAAVASKHLGVFMETAEFEAETGIKLDPDLSSTKSASNEDALSDQISSNQENKEILSDAPVEAKSVRKKAHPRSKKKRFALKRVINIVS